MLAIFVESIVSAVSTTIIFFGFADPLPFILVDYFALVARQPLITLAGSKEVSLLAIAS